MSVFCSNSPNGVTPLNTYALLISSIYLTPNDVLTALLKLKPKYNSPDGIPAFFLKSFATFLVSPLTKFFTYSLLSASLSQDWKLASVNQYLEEKIRSTTFLIIDLLAILLSQVKSLRLWSRNVDLLILWQMVRFRMPSVAFSQVDLRHLICSSH